MFDFILNVIAKDMKFPAIFSLPSSSALKADKHEIAYRPDIDGLRALAILSVVGYHAFPDWAPGGFVGVDIFFVISGYLITGIIARALDKSRFSLREFYARRIRRIFPALTFVLLCCLLAGSATLWNSEYAHLGKHALLGGAFLANFGYWREAGYFDAAAQTKPLLHLWSLGIEEQFYLLWPLLLTFAWRFVNPLRLLTAIAVLSLGWDLYLTSVDSVAAFYSPLSRFWELGCGGLLAMISHARPHYFAHSARRQTALGVIGLALVAMAFLALNKNVPFPGWRALLPVIGACLMIAAGPQGPVNRWILSNPLAVWFGVISYPLYLWHWPLLTFANITIGEEPSRALRIALVLGSIILAWLTYQLIEKPARFRLQPARAVPALITLMLAVVAASAYIYADGGLPGRFPAGQAQIAAGLDTQKLIESWEDNARFGICHLQEAGQKIRAAACIEKKRPLVMLWGDSHAASLYAGLRHLQEQESYNFGIAQMTQGGCGPMLDLPTLTFRKDCNKLNRQILGQAALLMPDLIILDAAWIHGDYPLPQDQIAGRVVSTVDQIRAASPQSRILVIGPAPRWTSDLPAYYRNSIIFHGRIPDLYTDRHLDRSTLTLDADMKSKLAAAHINYLSVLDDLCRNGTCLTRLAQDTLDILDIDDQHLSPKAAAFFADHAMADILDSTLNVAHAGSAQQTLSYFVTAPKPLNQFVHTCHPATTVLDQYPQQRPLHYCRNSSSPFSHCVNSSIRSARFAHMNSQIPTITCDSSKPMPCCKDKDGMTYHKCG